MKTVCHTQLDFGTLFKKQITVDFEGGQISSDGGACLIREVDEKYSVTEQAGKAFCDKRDGRRITHKVAIVTGASPGIGIGLSRGLLERAAEVYMCSCTPKNIATAAESSYRLQATGGAILGIVGG